MDRKMIEAVEEATIEIMAMTDEELVASMRKDKFGSWGGFFEAACGTCGDEPEDDDPLPDLFPDHDSPVRQADPGEAGCDTCWSTLADRLHGRPMACAKSGKPAKTGETCSACHDSSRAFARWSAKKSG